jgi:DNA-binding CsgD family transcriptional regulator/PAS domain-containing protein
MYFFPALALVSCIFYFKVGFLVLLRNIKSYISRSFFYLSLSIGLCSFFSIFAYPAQGPECFAFWIQLSLASAVFFATTQLLFFIALILNKKLYLFIAPFLYATPVILAALSITGDPFILYEMAEGYWAYIPRYDSFWFYFYYNYLFICITVSIVLLIHWYRSTHLKREKTQVKLIISGIVLTTSLIVTEGFILPAVFGLKCISLTPVLFVFFMLGIYIAATRYRFLDLTPESICNLLMAEIDEAIILVDPCQEILFLNKTARDLTGFKKGELIHQSLSNMIMRYEVLEPEILKLVKGDVKSICCRFSLRCKEMDEVQIDAKFSPVKDRFKDILGIILVGNEVKELVHFKSVYKISRREANVIQYLVRGKTNREIGELLGIAERTVKTHITHIYCKLKVDNKIELINLLKDFNLFSEKHAEKPVLLI